MTGASSIDKASESTYAVGMESVKTNARRGFRNGTTAIVHEDIVMDDHLYVDAVRSAKTADPISAGVIIARIYSMRTNKCPDGVDWTGIAKSLAKSL